jgi:hypothetical protein
LLHCDNSTCLGKAPTLSELERLICPGITTPAATEGATVVEMDIELVTDIE